jgi:UMF1 family MFS transporter
MVATIGFSGSLVFYNAYLPEIASPDCMDEVSAKGFSQGYIGSLILQIACLIPVLMPEKFGITAGTGLKISFIAVGLWWGLWALIPLMQLPPDRAPKESNVNWLLGGFQELGKVWHEAQTNKPLLRYLFAFLFYNMGVQTIMYLASLFGDTELHLPSHKLIITIILLQVVAIGGARLFARVSEKQGNIRTLQIIIMIWLVVCVWAYFVQEEYGFYGVASLVGLVMGGVQSMSRSTFAKLMPPTKDVASYFSFYDVTEKVSIVGGTFVFGLVLELTGSMRNSILFLAVLFVVGGLLLTRVKSAKGV